MSSHSLPSLRNIIRTHGIHARKKLGQNFILDLNLNQKIACAAGPLNDVTVIEIGAGPGGLTHALLNEGAAHIMAIECDKRAIAALKESAIHYAPRLTIIPGNALKQDYAKLAGDKTRIVANLPYNIATILLTRWLSVTPWPPFFDRLVLMLQKEVAERIIATPQNKKYGRLSILAQWRCEPKILFNVSRTAFTPIPKVDSTLISLSPRQTIYPCQCDTLEKVTAEAFGQRRKMLQTSLKKLVADVPEWLRKMNLDPKARAETLSVENFCALAHSLDKKYEKD
ncbi:MAG: 16S rRNA (adenine(1518)-N(6)/adenine(1519)-N(6))-dimethyltransferase RsmA [Alphaproteobacteria bacterium]|nr:16S rRNA (adenine(1518)-N(6)/adenine(1519)-N(6))-dimethyltransferase RsmA [Alphaproteobacteria bacterium]